MAGIYIHIPFCRRACNYCDFHFTTNLSKSNELVVAILNEISLRKDYLKDELVETIYFGGGTPSLLPTTAIKQILDSINTYNKVVVGAEITLEANPEDLTTEKLIELKSIGINRLSLGTQSFIDSELKWMNRMHSAKQAEECVRAAQRIGFNNISIDLIFGLPNQTKQNWQFNLDKAISLNVQHISSYSLTVEAKTVLGNRVKKGLQSAPDDNLASDFFKMNMRFLTLHGFEHYEISNFAVAGYISKHNSSYWKNVNYLGLGPSAHSYNGISRQWNVKSNTRYTNLIARQEGFFETETLSVNDKLNEHILTGLRTKWGIQKMVIEQISPTAWEEIINRLNPLEMENFVFENDAITLSNQGKLITDSLTSELFF
ncbi:radical SAM family heme chaperone HemW [Bacteroidota bacterium]